MPQTRHDPQRLPRWSAVVMVVVPLWFALAEASLQPWALNPDGIAYLDQAAAWRAGDFTNAINSYWSPAYPWLLAIWGAVTEPMGLHVIPGAHVLNVVIAGVFVSAVAGLHRQLDQHLAALEVGRLRRWVVWGVACAMATVVVAWLTTPRLLTPDLLLATALVVMAAACLKVVTEGPTGARPWFHLGLLGGIAYLIKIAGLPVAVVMCGCAVLAAPGLTPRTVLRRGMWSVLGGALLVLPWAGALSVSEGRPTLGASATLNRSWSWADGIESAVREVEKQSLRSVPAESYGTHPLWYAPHRHIGAATSRPWRPGRVLDVVRNNFLAPQVLRWHLLLLACAGVVVAARAASLPARELVAVAVLLIPPLAGMVMYLLVHAEGRFYGGYLVLASLAACMSAAILRGRGGWVLMSALTLVVLVGVRPLIHVHPLPGWGPYPNPYLAVQDRLTAAGATRGASVAVVGDAYLAYWALPAGVRIAATLELPSAVMYTEASPERRAVWDQAFRAAGAKVVVLTHGPYKATVLPLEGVATP